MSSSAKDSKPDKKKDDAVDALAAQIDQIHVTERTTPPPPEEDSPLHKIAHWIQHHGQILVLTGAGVSVAAGIPDFRSPGTGLYDNLQKYNLPYPEAVFDVDFYRRHPQPFVSLAQEIWPGIHYAPTLTHAFVTLLHRKDLLLRNYSQNIDGLEYLAQLPAEQLVECHGHFRSAKCIQCFRKAEIEAVRTSMVQEAKVPICPHCRSYVKPDIVFFGESLPDRFHTLLSQDLPVAKVCLILGTSLQVAPVSLIPEKVGPHCKRILLNKERVGNMDDSDRDVFYEGDCDDTILELAQILGWEQELRALHKQAKQDMKRAVEKKKKEG